VPKAKFSKKLLGIFLLSLRPIMMSIGADKIGITATAKDVYRQALSSNFVGKLEGFTPMYRIIPEIAPNIA